jgi:hypothetical protein
MLWNFEFMLGGQIWECWALGGLLHRIYDQGCGCTGV